MKEKRFLVKSETTSNFEQTRQERTWLVVEGERVVSSHRSKRRAQIARAGVCTLRGVLFWVSRFQQVIAQ